MDPITTTTLATPYRIEYDLLGEEPVPADAYYGIQTQRAVRNFRISGVPISHFPELIRALAMVKQAAAYANLQTGQLDVNKGSAIERACTEIINGRWHDQFVVDVIQGGAGTSTNMNANEVIANLALEIIGLRQGRLRLCTRTMHVNMSQSTNDVYPTAARLAPHPGSTTSCARRWSCLIDAFELEGGRVRRGPQDGPNPASGCGAHDPGPGVRGLRRDPRRGHRQLDQAAATAA